MFNIMLAVYFFGFIVPLILQMFFLEDKFQEMVANTLCLVTSICFACIEYYQIKDEGISYFLDFFNIVDFTMFLVYPVCFWLRMKDTQITLPPLDG